MGFLSDKQAQTTTTIAGKPAIGAAEDRVASAAKAVSKAVNAIADEEDKTAAVLAVAVFLAVFKGGERRYPTLFRSEYVSVLAERLGCSKALVYSRDKTGESGLIPERLVPAGVLQLTWAGRTPTIALAGTVTKTGTATPVTDTLLAEARAQMKKLGFKI